MERISKNKYNVKKSKHGKEKKKLTKKQKIILIVSIIVTIVSIIGIVLGTYIYKAGGSVTEAAINIMADVVGDETPFTALVLGVSEGIDTPLTDTIILVGYNPKVQKSFMLSIPRDTFIGNNENTANGYDKINALYQKDVKKTVKAVEKLTGVNIDYYIVVKTTALVDMVNAIGGVEFDVPIDMKYDDPTQNLHIDLKKGMQLIDGNKAEQLLRYRHSNPDRNGKMTTYPASYGSDDFGRMRTQREFIVVTAKQMVSWKNITKLKDITSAVFNNLETDMSLAKMIGYIPSALKLDTEAIRAEQLPGESAMFNNLWFYSASLSKTQTLVTELMESLELSEKEYKEKYTPISTKSTVVKQTKPVDDEALKKESSLFVEAEMSNTVSDKITNTTVNTNTNTSITTECNHNWNLTSENKATCTNGGTKTYTCTSCSKTKTENTTAIGHTWSEKSRTESTVDAEGSIVSECTICHTTSTKTIPKKEAPTVPSEQPSAPIEEQPTLDNSNSESGVESEG